MNKSQLREVVHNIVRRKMMEAEDVPLDTMLPKDKTDKPEVDPKKTSRYSCYSEKFGCRKSKASTDRW